MPTIDLKRAITDHFKTLNPEQRKAFGRRLKEVITARARTVIDRVPVPDAPHPYPILSTSGRENLTDEEQRRLPFTLKDMLGERTDLLFDLADRMASGEYDEVPEEREVVLN